MKKLKEKDYEHANHCTINPCFSMGNVIYIVGDQIDIWLRLYSYKI